MSIAVWYSGNVSKEYLLASAVNAGFLTLDLPFRVARICEAAGVAKGPMYFFTPILAAICFFSVQNYMQM